MSKLEEITRKIKDEREDSQRLRKIARRSEGREEELLEAVDQARERLKGKRERRKALRDEDTRRDQEGNPWSDEDRDRMLEDVADDIEDAEDVLDELLERLDARKSKTDRVERKLETHQERVKRLREKRRRIREEREGRLTQDWHVREFDCRQGGPVPSYMEDDLRALCRQVLQPMRDRFGPARCNSGHRWDWYNASIGGASGSYHVYEDRKRYPAADLWFERGSPQEWAAYARQLGAGGVGTYSNFVHVDPGPRRDWSG
jgi:hypothetical protein